MRDTANEVAALAEDRQTWRCVAFQLEAELDKAEVWANLWKRAAKIHFRHHRHQREIAVNWKDSLYLAQVDCRRLKAEIERLSAQTLADSSAALTEALAILDEVNAAGNLWPAQQQRLAALKTTTNGQPGKEGADATA